MVVYQAVAMLLHLKLKQEQHSLGLFFGLPVFSTVLISRQQLGLTIDFHQASNGRHVACAG